MAKFKIIFNKKSCIGAGECEVLSKEFWKVQGNGKADLAGSVLNPKTGNYELELDESHLKKQEGVMRSCPVSCIKIEKIN